MMWVGYFTLNIIMQKMENKTWNLDSSQLRLHKILSDLSHSPIIRPVTNLSIKRLKMAEKLPRLFLGRRLFNP